MNVKPISSTYPIRQMKSKKEKMLEGECTNRNLHLIQMALEAARPYGLEAEVMWSALTLAAEANEHGQTMEDVLNVALGEWDVDPDHPLTKSDEGQMYNMTAKDVERHRGLEIGEDGSVNGLI